MQRCVAVAMHRALPRSVAPAGIRCFRHRAFCAAAAGGSRRQSPVPPPVPDAALLPHSVHGIVSNYFDHHRPEWFVRPRGAGSPCISMPRVTWNDAVRDHCNGHLLYEPDEESLWVLNPATRRLAVLPPPPLQDGVVDFWRGTAGAYLAFDPSVSLDYQVFLIPEVPEPDDDDDGSAEWPPAVHRMQVYSSRSGEWEERAFVREGGGPPGWDGCGGED